MDEKQHGNSLHTQTLLQSNYGCNNTSAFLISNLKFK